MKAILPAHVRAIHWRADAARASLGLPLNPAWGYGRERWRRAYQATRAFCAGGSHLFNWAIAQPPAKLP